MQSMIKRAQEILTPYKDIGFPDPSFVLQLPDEVYTGSNLYAIQKSFEGEFQFDVFFESASSKQKLSCKQTAIHVTFYPELIVYTASIIDQGIPALVASYEKRFQSVFPYPIDYPTEKKQSLEAFSKAITSNLVGGVGYFYGTSIVNRKFSYEWDEDDEADSPASSEEKQGGARLTDPKALLTATPSRSFFPRGFYWQGFLFLTAYYIIHRVHRDEGFHLLHIGLWDNDFRFAFPLPIGFCSDFA